MIVARFQRGDEGRIVSPAVSFWYQDSREFVPNPGYEVMYEGERLAARDLDQDPLKAIVESKRKLNGMPVVAGASFGHTTPQFTFPIGGYGCLRAGDAAVRLSIEVH